MLVLKRNVGEMIRIGDDIEVILVAAWDGKARIGVEAPPAVAVHRNEIYEKLKAKGETRPVKGAPAVVARLLEYRRAGIKWIEGTGAGHAFQTDPIELDALLEYLAVLEARADRD